MPILFVSDIHLSAARPTIVDDFVGLLEDKARTADALYILGDCFDLYLGDDDTTDPHPRVMLSLRELTASGVAVNVVHGNHDFLMGADFERATGCRLLEDLTVIDLFGTKTLIMHGDTLCTDDVDYQAFRSYSRDPGNQKVFLGLRLEARRAESERLRAKSQDQTRLKPEEIMDVSDKTVTEVMLAKNVSHLIHGHTHRPAVHDVELEGALGKRIVLGDWYDDGSVLCWDDSGYRHAKLDEL